MNTAFATSDLTSIYILVKHNYKAQIDFVKQNNQNEYCY